MMIAVIDINHYNEDIDDENYGLVSIIYDNDSMKSANPEKNTVFLLMMIVPD